MKKKTSLLTTATVIIFCLSGVKGWGQNVDGNYRTKSSGNWSSVNIWQQRTAGSWVDATVIPGASDTVSIQNGHTINIDNNYDIGGIYLNTSGVIACGSNVLSIYGTVKAYSGSAVTLLSDAPYTSSTSPSNGNVTCSANGRFKFVGTSRNLTITSWWGANGLTTSAIVEFALTSGQTGTFNTGFKANTIIITSGTIDMQSFRLAPAGNATPSGSLTMNGGILISSSSGSTGGNQVISSQNSSRCADVTINAGATLRLTSINPTIDADVIMLNGTVEYARSGSQNLLIKSGNDPSASDITVYNNLTLSGSSNKTTPNNLTTTINGTLSLQGTASIVLGTSATLAYGSNGTLEYAGSSSQTTGALSVAWPSGNGPSNLVINNSNGVTLNASGGRTINGKLTLASGSLSQSTPLTLGDGATIIRSGGSLSTAPTFGPTVNVTYNQNSSSITSGNEIPASQTILNNLTVNNSNGIVLNSSTYVNGTLAFGSVDNTTLTTGANLVLKSTSSGTARVGDITNGNTNSGNKISGSVTVERYMPAKASWRFLTAPVAGNGAAISLQAAYQSNNGMGIVLFRPNGGNGFTNDGVATSIRYYNRATQKWVDVSGTDDNSKADNNISGSATSAANNAYAVFVTGPHDVSGTTTTYIHGTAQPTTTLVTGSLQTNQQQFTIENGNDKYTLLGNPYPSPVDLDAFDQANGGNSGNVKNVYYVWDPNLSGIYGVGGYVTIMRTSPGNFTYAPVSANDPSVTPNTQYRYIQSGQAFFVTGKGNGNTVNFQENQKASNTFLTPFRQGTQLEKLNINLSFVNPSGGFVVTDGVAALYNNNYSANTTDAEDAEKFTNGTEALSIVRSDKRMAMEARPLINANDTIFLNIAKMRNTTYRFDFIPDNFSASGLTASLQDSYTGTETAIHLAANSNYTFTVFDDAASSATDRFRIVFRSGNVLPVDFTLLKAQQKNSHIIVSWKLSSEEGVHHYEVEKSTDGLLFSIKANIPVNNNIDGNEWLDMQPNNGNNYYHIKVIEKTGAVKYSTIVDVKMGEWKREILVYPNPLSGNLFVLQLNHYPKGDYAVQLFNSLGQEVFYRTIEHSGGSSTVSFSLAKQLPNGIYQLRIKGAEATNVQSIIINE